MSFDQYPFRHQRVIPFGDTDAARIVYTPRFSDYCMEAAEVWFRQCLDLDWFESNTAREVGTPVVHMTIDFKSGLYGNDHLSTFVRVKKIGRTTVTLTLDGYRERGGDVLCFEACYVFCITQGGVATPLDGGQREKIQQYIDQCE